MVFLPVVLWNAGHDWISFRFQFGRVGETRFDPVYVLTLLAVQPLIFNPYAAVFVVRGIRLWLTPAMPYGRDIGVLLATAIPTVVFIIFQATHGEVLQHWLAPVFPTLALVAVAAASTIPDDARLLRRLRTDAVPLRPHRGAGCLYLRDDAPRPVLPRQGPARFHAWLAGLRRRGRGVTGEVGRKMDRGRRLRDHG